MRVCLFRHSRVKRARLSQRRSIPKPARGLASRRPGRPPVRSVAVPATSAALCGMPCATTVSTTRHGGPRGRKEAGSGRPAEVRAPARADDLRRVRPAFRSAVQPVEIAAALQRECDNNAQILSRDRRLVPNDFHVELARPTSTGSRRTTPRWPSDLTEQLEEHADAAGLRLPRAGHDRLRDRRRPDHRPVPGPQPGAGQACTGSATAPRYAGRARPRGQRHPAPARPPGLVVGRGTEADVRINDPGVSRRHVEFVVDRPSRRDSPSIEVRDLGSTNGMLVDGHRVTAGRAARRQPGQDRQHHDRSGSSRTSPRRAVRCLS